MITKLLKLLLPLIILGSCGGTLETDGSLEKINRASAIEIDEKTGESISKGESIDGQVHKNSLIMRYSRALNKVECSNTLLSTKTVGLVNDSVASIPSHCKFMKVYFTKDGNPASKIFSIKASTYVDIKEIIEKDLNSTDSAKLKTIPAFEVSKEIGIPVKGGDILDLKIYSGHLIIQYPKTLAKVKYSNNLENINIIGIADDNIAIIPMGFGFMKIYFIDDGQLVSKVFDIIAPTN